MKCLARFLAERLTRPKRRPDYIIGGYDNPSMKRWWLIPRNKVFNIYLHNMLRDDEDDLHDHPWWSVSLVLDGWLRDTSCNDMPLGTTMQKRTLVQGDWVLRRPSTAHRLEVFLPAWTLFFTGPVIREWGFWCPKGWKPWKEYVGNRNRYDTTLVAKNRGCGEDD